jgi:cation diffusion facilitator CzcD-associated flavoprotein CzcO
LKENNHPQVWPENLNVVDKTIIVIGSGATAVTIVPELAAEAKSYYAATITNLYCRPPKDVAARIKRLFLKR